MTISMFARPKLMKSLAVQCVFIFLLIYCMPALSMNSITESEERNLGIGLLAYMQENNYSVKDRIIKITTFVVNSQKVRRKHKKLVGRWSEYLNSKNLGDCDENEVKFTSKSLPEELSLKDESIKMSCLCGSLHRKIEYVKICSTLYKLKTNHVSSNGWKITQLNKLFQYPQLKLL